MKLYITAKVLRLRDFNRRPKIDRKKPVTDSAGINSGCTLMIKQAKQLYLSGLSINAPNKKVDGIRKGQRIFRTCDSKSSRDTRALFLTLAR